MTQVGFLDLDDLLFGAGFAAGTPTQEGISVVCAESGRNPAAIHHNMAADGVTIDSTDRGLWQINDKWHPEVTDAMAFDPALATREAARISNNGNNFGPWSTFANGAYKAHMEAAAVAMAGGLARRTLQASLSTANSNLAVVSVQLASAQALLTSTKAQLTQAQSDLTAAHGTITLLQAKIAKAQADLTA